MKIALAWVDMADPTDRTVAENLSRELRGLGHGICLVGPRRRKGEPFQESVQGVPLFRVGPSDELAARQLLRLHSQEGIDVWHAHVFGRSHKALARAARLGGWRMLITPHLILKDYLPFLGGAAGFRDLLKAAFHVTVLSKAARREFLQLCPEWKKRCSVVHNGMGLRSVSPMPKSIRKPYALCVARIAPYKGHDLLLMAFSKMREEFPDLRLVLCGRDQAGGGIRRLIRSLGLEDRVILAGELPPSQVEGLLRGCEFFVLASRRENFPLAVLEAMRAGRAVIASATGGAVEMIRDGVSGLLAAPGDVDALAQRMIELSRNRALRERLGRSARRASRSFTWRHAAAEYSRLYGRAGASRRSS